MEEEIPEGWSRTAWDNYERSLLLPPETPDDVIFYAPTASSTDTPLKEAAKCGDLDKVKALVEAGAPTSEHNIFGCESPLIIAVSNGHLEIVKFLLANGADTWTRGPKHGRTALHIACMEGRLPIVKALLEADAGLLTKYGVDFPQTPLYYAASEGHLAVVEFLLQFARGGGTTTRTQWGCNAVVLRETKDASRAVYFACRNGHYEIVLLLLAYGVDERFCKRDRKTLLHHWSLHHVAKEAIENGETSDVAKLLACDAADPFDQENKPRIVPICVAALRGDLEMVRALSSMEREIFSRDAEVSPLSCAAGRGHLDVVKFLLNADRDWSNLRKVSVALIAAAENDRVEVLAFLISKGINVDAEKSGTGETALLAATRRSNTRAMKLLLEHGASVHARLREDGATCLHIAAKEYNWEATRLLAVHGANLNTRDNTLSTPLDVATSVVDKATGKLRFRTKRGVSYKYNLEQLERLWYEGIRLTQ